MKMLKSKTRISSLRTKQNIALLLIFCSLSLLNINSDVIPTMAAPDDWNTITVDYIGDVGLYTSMVLDASDYPHISYYDATNGDLKCGFLNSSGWYTETVDYIGNVGQYTSLALDTAGYPHISYYDVSNADLKYAFQNSNGWQITAVDNHITDAIGWYTSLALDTAGYPHISYYDCNKSKV